MRRTFRGEDVYFVEGIADAYRSAGAGVILLLVRRRDGIGRAVRLVGAADRDVGPKSLGQNRLA